MVYSWLEVHICLKSWVAWPPTSCSLWQTDAIILAKLNRHRPLSQIDPPPPPPQSNVLKINKHVGDLIKELWYWYFKKKRNRQNDWKEEAPLYRHLSDITEKIVCVEHVSSHFCSLTMHGCCHYSQTKTKRLKRWENFKFNTFFCLFLVTSFHCISGTKIAGPLKHF